MTRRELLFSGVGAALTAGVLLGLQLWGNAKGAEDGREARARNAGASSSIGTYSPPVDPSTEQAWRAANEDLAQSVSRVRRRLEENEAQKKALEHELAEARGRLAQAEGGAPAHNPYDLTAADWKELAKTGSVRARFPCNFDPRWSVGDATAGSLGLSPSDKAAVEKAGAPARTSRRVRAAHPRRGQAGRLYVPPRRSSNAGSAAVPGLPSRGPHAPVHVTDARIPARGHRPPR